jgi:Tol biopolymer transport system component
MPPTLWRRRAQSQCTNERYGGDLLIHALVVVAVWVSVSGCGSEQEDNAATSPEKRSAATETRASGETSQRTSASITFTSDRDGDFEIYAMDTDGTDQTRLTDNASYDGQPTLSFEGEQVALASDRDGSNDIYVMDSNDGQQTRLTTAAVRSHEPLEPSFSPDGSKIAFARTRTEEESFLFDDPEIYVMDSDGTNAKRVTNNQVTDFNPVFSPGGDKIAFTSEREGNSEIYVMDSDGTNVTRLTHSPAESEVWPVFSPDGDKIAFTRITGSDQSPIADIYIMSADGTDQSRLTDSPAYDAQPAFSPGGDKIAFTSNRDVSDFEIYAMDSEGTNLTRLTKNRTEDHRPVFSSAPRSTTVAEPRASEGSNPIRLTDNLCYYPTTQDRTVVLSPDGSKVTFHGCGDSTGIFVANSDGTGVTDHTGSQDVEEGQYGLTFSPSSDRIVFQRETAASVVDDDLYAVDLDGTNLRNLTDDPSETTHHWPTFSPDGDKIAFLRTSGPNEALRSDIYVMNADGTDPTNLTKNLRGLEILGVYSPDEWPAFSPSGEKVAFVGTTESGESPNSDIYVIGAHGTSLTNLTDSPEESENWPTFSSDGQKVAFVRNTGYEKSDIYVANIDGTDLTRLTDNPGPEVQPAFIPGTKKVAFVSPRDGDDDIYTVDSDATNLTNLTNTDSSSENNPAFSADGTKMAFARARYDSGGLVAEICVMTLGD